MLYPGLTEKREYYQMQRIEGQKTLHHHIKVTDFISYTKKGSLGTVQDNQNLDTK